MEVDSSFAWPAWFNSRCVGGPGRVSWSGATCLIINYANIIASMGSSPVRGMLFGVSNNSNTIITIIIGS